MEVNLSDVKRMSVRRNLEQACTIAWNLFGIPPILQENSLTYETALM